MKFFRGLVMALGISALLWVMAISFALASHISNEVQVGDVASPIMICNDQTVTYDFYKVAITGGQLDEDMLDRLQRKCVVGEMLKDSVIQRMRVARILDKYTNQEDVHVYFVRYVPINGFVVWGVTMSDRILEKGENNGRRTDRR